MALYALAVVVLVMLNGSASLLPCLLPFGLALLANRRAAGRRTCWLALLCNGVIGLIPPVMCYLAFLADNAIVLSGVLVLMALMLLTLGWNIQFLWCRLSERRRPDLASLGTQNSPSP
ncbi:hypothetical protein [Pseudaeromonas paramecii]|uniref:hypothetical protein n=1 Tax=Pseudaeromonas paramecii TaxID=2138166 RepID=UPI0031EE1E19